MDFANARRESTLMSNNNIWNYKIENFHTDVACCCKLQQQENGAMSLFFWNQGKNIWFVNIGLHLSTLVKWHVYTPPNSSSDLSTHV